MRAVGYFRESPSFGTLAQQNKAFLDFCLRSGLDADVTFVDGSSANGAAPGFRELIAYLRHGEHPDSVVVIPSVEALGADLAHAARRYFQLEGLGAQIAPITSSGASGTDEILAAWAEQGSEGRVGDRVRAAMRRKAVKGEVLGRPPYGYKVGNRRRLELVPEEAVVIRYIYRLYLQDGLGIRLIARRLNEEGLRTRRGGNWSMVSIRDILRNRVYLGTYSRFGVRVPGSHPALVSVDDFRLVQDRLNARRTSYNPRVTSQFLLSGIAFCGACGNKLIGVSRKQSWRRRSGERVENSYRYYQCESRTNQSVCRYHTRRAGDLEEEVRALLASALASRELLPEAEDAVAATDQQREYERIRARLRAVDRRIERYVDAAAKGRLPKDRMHRLGIAAAADRLVLEDACESVEQRIAARQDGAERRASREHAVGELLRGWAAMPFARRQAGVREAIARLTVHDDRVELTPRP
jgi:DNA invertase Pin-like site-specific DNA recombinase